MKQLLPLAFLALTAAVNADHSPHVSLPLPIADALMGVCAEILTVQQSGNIYSVSCMDNFGRNRSFIFRMDAAGYLYLDGQ